MLAEPYGCAGAMPSTHCPFFCSSWPLQNVFRVYCLSDASREKELKVWEVNAELDELAAAARECQAEHSGAGRECWCCNLAVGSSGRCTEQCCRAKGAELLHLLPTPPHSRAVLRGSEATERRCQILRRLLTRCNPDMAFYLVRTGGLGQHWLSPQLLHCLEGSVRGRGRAKRLSACVL